MSSEDSIPRCSFCGRSEDEVEKLVRTAKANICDACVDMLSGVVAESGTYTVLYAGPRSEAGERLYREWVAPAVEGMPLTLSRLPELPVTPNETMEVVEEVREHAGLLLDLVNLDKRTVHLLSCARLMARKPCVALVRDAECFPVQAPWLRLVEMVPLPADPTAQHAAVAAALRSVVDGALPAPSEDLSESLDGWNELFALVDRACGDWKSS